MKINLETITRHSDNGHLYLTAHYELEDAPLWWHQHGLQQTQSGYGSKLTSSKVCKVAGVKRRVYVTQYSNAGTAWIVLGGKRIIID